MGNFSTKKVILFCLFLRKDQIIDLKLSQSNQLVIFMWG